MAEKARDVVTVADAKLLGDLPRQRDEAAQLFFALIEVLQPLEVEERERLVKALAVWFEVQL